MKFDSFLALRIRVENENSLFDDNAVCHGNREPFPRDAIRESATVDEGENRIIRGKASKISRHIAGKSRVASERTRSSHMMTIRLISGRATHQIQSAFTSYRYSIFI